MVRMSAFFLADALPCEPVMYCFLRALVFTCPLPFGEAALEPPALKVMPPRITASMSSPPWFAISVMEKSYACERHGNVVLVARLDDVVVAHRASGLGHILHATLVGTLDVVAEGEEGIAAQ